MTEAQIRNMTPDEYLHFVADNQEKDHFSEIVDNEIEWVEKEGKLESISNQLEVDVEEIAPGNDSEINNLIELIEENTDIKANLKSLKRELKNLHERMNKHVQDIFKLVDV